MADADEWRTREFAVDLQAHVEEGEGRTVYGRAVPFGEITPVHEFGRTFTEEFQRGAFRHACAGPPKNVKFLFAHNEEDPLGVARKLEERGDGLYADLWVSRGTRGDQILEWVRDGVLDSLSIRFRGLQPRNFGDHVAWREAMLREISLVPWGQYKGAWAAARAEGEPDPTPNLTEARRLLAAWPDLQARLKT